MTRRSHLLLLTLSLIALPGLARAVDVKFMTHNVRSPGWNQARRAQIVGAIDDQSPDALGLQEAQPGGNGDELLTDLQDDYEPHHTNTSEPIYLRRDRSFQVVEEGVEMLTACQVGGPVPLTWVVIETPEGARFNYYNVHLCVSSAQLGGDPEGNQMQAIEAATFMDSNAEAGAIHLLGGDLNANQNSPTILYLRDGTPLTIGGETFVNPIDLDDSWEMSEANERLEKPGTGAFVPSPVVLDWILVDPTADVTAAEVIELVIPPGEEDSFSDHLPVTATLDLPAPAKVPALSASGVWVLSLLLLGVAKWRLNPRPCPQSGDGIT